jgi:hypothetical protein
VAGKIKSGHVSAIFQLMEIWNNATAAGKPAAAGASGGLFNEQAPARSGLFDNVDGVVGTSRNTESVAITALVVNHRLAVDQLQGPVRTDLEAFTGAAAPVPVDIDLHG